MLRPTQSLLVIVKRHNRPEVLSRGLINTSSSWTYLNVFHALIDNIHFWESTENTKKSKIFDTFLNKSKNNDFLVDYFDKYLNNLKNNTLNSYLKSVVKA